MTKPWEYTIDAYGDCVTIQRNVDNTISSVTVDVDSYATRDWTEEEVNEGLPKYDPEYMQDEEPQFTEYGEGASATLKFDVDDGVAEFAGVKHGSDHLDPDKFNYPTWLRLLTPAQRMVENVPGVEYCEDAQAYIGEQIGIGEKITIRGLDDE